MIVLRPLQASDAGDLFPLLAGVAETLLVDDGPGSCEGLEAALMDREEMAEAGLVRAYTVLNEETGVVMGSVRLKFGQGRGEIGVWLGQEFQGRGYGTEAIARVVDEGFGELQLSRIEAHVFAGNAASKKAFENNGFVVERVERNRVMQRGEFRDVWVMAVRPATS